MKGIKQQKSPFRTKTCRNLIFYCLLLAFPVAQFCVFYIGTNINSILLAFKAWDTSTSSFVFQGADNFVTAFKNLFTVNNYKVATKNTLLVYALGWVTMTPFTQVVSYFIYKKAPFSGGLKVILFAPSIVSVMVLVTMYQYFVEDAIPALWEAFTGEKITGLLANPSSRFATLFVYGLWHGFGTGMLLYVNAMNSISPSIVEASQIDGANFVQEYFYVTFPMIFGTFKTMTVIGVAGILGNQFMLYEFYGLYAPTNVSTLGYLLFQSTMMSERSYGEVAALGIILTCICVPITLLAQKFLNKIDPTRV